MKEKTINEKRKNWNTLKTYLPEDRDKVNKQELYECDG